MALDKDNNPFTNYRLGFHRGVPGDNPLSEGLVAYYKEDESSGTRMDCGPNGIDLAEFGTVGGTSNGVIGRATRFTGAGRLTSVTNTILDDMVGEDYTITGWFTVTDLLSSGTMISIGNGGLGVGNENLMSCFYESGGNSIVVATGLGASYNFAGSTINGGVPEGAYIFVAVKYVKSTNSIHIRLNNGTFSTNNLPSAVTVNAGAVVSLGSLAPLSINQNGKNDEVSIYNRLLTDSEVDFLQRGGGIIDDVVAGYFFDSATIGQDATKNAITLTGFGGFSSAPGIQGDSMAFDGIDAGALSITHSELDDLISHSFGITMWAYIDSTLTDNVTIFGLMGGLNTGDVLLNVTYYHPTPGIAATIYYAGGTSTSFVYQQIGGTLPKDEWFSIQLSFSHSSLTLSMSLNDNASTSVTIPSTTNVNTGLKVSLGSYMGVADYLKGRVDEVYIYDGSLTLEERRTRYMNGVGNRPIAPGRPPCAV